HTRRVLCSIALGQNLKARSGEIDAQRYGELGRLPLPIGERVGVRELRVDGSSRDKNPHPTPLPTGEGAGPRLLLTERRVQMAQNTNSAAAASQGGGLCHRRHVRDARWSAILGQIAARRLIAGWRGPARSKCSLLLPLTYL